MHMPLVTFIHDKRIAAHEKKNLTNIKQPLKYYCLSKTIESS